MSRKPILSAMLVLALALSFVFTACDDGGSGATEIPSKYHGTWEADENKADWNMTAEITATAITMNLTVSVPFVGIINSVTTYTFISGLKKSTVQGYHAATDKIIIFNEGYLVKKGEENVRLRVKPEGNDKLYILEGEDINARLLIRTTDS